MKLVIALLVLAFFPPVASAQSWPAKPVRFILPNSSGSGPDAVARIVSERLERALGQPFIVDNRPGANFFIAAEAIARAAPDGYTIGMGSATLSAINPATFKSMPYDPERDFDYVGVLIDTIWGFFGVHPSVPAKTFPEFIELAKKSPGKYTYGVTVPSNGMWTQWVMRRAGVELTEVVYKTTPQAVQDVIAGRVNATMNTFSSYEAFIKGGKLRALVAITPVRHPQWPDLPAIDEFYPGMGFESWIGVIAPKGAPRDMVQRLNRALDAVVRDAEFNKRALALGWSNREGARTPQVMAEMARNDRKRWGEIVRQAGKAGQ